LASNNNSHVIRKKYIRKILLNADFMPSKETYNGSSNNIRHKENCYFSMLIEVRISWTDL